MRGVLLLFLLGAGCRTLDRNLVADATASRIYHQCRYELLCVEDVKAWKCAVVPPPVRPSPKPGQCEELFQAEEELRWQAQVAEKARADTGRLPPMARAELRKAKAAVERK